MTIDLTQFTIHPDARWVAADYCGAVYAFTDRPVCFDGKHWMSDGEYSWHLGEIDMTGIDCRKTLTMLRAGATVTAWAEMPQAPVNVANGEK